MRKKLKIWLKVLLAKVNNGFNLTFCLISLVKDTINTVKETVTGGTTKNPQSADNASEIDPIKAAEINPMGQTPNRPPQTDPQTPINKTTKELQKEGAKRKAEEDSFNLM